MVTCNLQKNSRIIETNVIHRFFHHFFMNFLLHLTPSSNPTLDQCVAGFDQLANVTVKLKSVTGVAQTFPNATFTHQVNPDTATNSKYQPTIKPSVQTIVIHERTAQTGCFIVKKRTGVLWIFVKCRHCQVISRRI